MSGIWMTASWKGAEASYDLVTNRPKVRMGPYLMPEQYLVRINWQGRYQAVLTVAMSEGRPVCEKLELSRIPGGPPIAGEFSRLPIAEIIRFSAPTVALRVKKGQKGAWAPLDPADTQAFYSVLRKAGGQKGRAPVSDERLRQVAKVYRDASPLGRPVRAVTDALGISRSHAGRLVMMARRRMDPETREPFLEPPEGKP